MRRVRSLFAARVTDPRSRRATPPFVPYDSRVRREPGSVDGHSYGHRSATCDRAHFAGARAHRRDRAHAEGILRRTQEISCRARARWALADIRRACCESGGGGTPNLFFFAAAFGERDRPLSIAEWRKELTGGRRRPALSCLARPDLQLPLTGSGPPARVALGPFAGAPPAPLVVIAALAALPWCCRRSRRVAGRHLSRRRRPATP
jgi:hypothetical protein